MSYTKTKEILNQLVADFSQMSANIHQVHWYMRGQGFLTLHPLLDTFKADVDEQLDDCAERLITLDGSPYSTLEEFYTNSKIKASTANWTDTLEERFAMLVDGYRYLSNLLQEGIDAAGDEGDNVTEDMLIDMLGSIQKRIWMVQAHFGKAPEIDA